MTEPLTYLPKLTKLSEQERYLQKLLMKRLVKINSVILAQSQMSSVWGRLGHLVRKAYIAIDREADIKIQIEQLLHFVYQEQGFFCHAERYFSMDNIMLDKVLETREAGPLTLGTLVLYLAEALNLPLFPVNFPSQLLLRAEVNEEVAFIDPWNGKYVFYETLEKMIEGYLGFGHELSMDYIARADAEMLENRLLQYIKNGLMREGRNIEAFRLVEWCLEQYPDDPYEIRDRGIVLASLDCAHLALDDLKTFIERCPDDPTVELLRLQILGLEQDYSFH